MRLYGTGSLWLRKSKKHPKGAWWLRYFAGARRVTQDSGFCECCAGRAGRSGRAQAEAEKMLAKRIGQSEAGVLPSPRAQRTLMEDLAQTTLKDHRLAL